MERLVYFTGDIALVDNLGIEECMEIQEPLKKLHDYEIAEEQCIKETSFGFKELLHKWKVFTDDVQELLEYRRLEEQGLLLRLPCKVGDTVWFTDRKYDRENRRFIEVVHNGYVKAIKFSARPTRITIEYDDLDDNYGRCKGHDINASTIGKGVFLTKEEAEKKLESMKGE